MKYTTVIFDMDGTIIETENIWKQANRELILSRGVKLPDAELSKLDATLHGLSTQACCQIIKDLCQLPDAVDDLVIEKKNRAVELYSVGINFIQGFVEFHKQLQTKNVKSAVATNATQPIVEITDKKLNLKQFFGNHLYHMDHVNNRSKPDPAVFLYAAEQLNVAPENCIVIEDSPHGIRAAKNAGMYCIAINTSKKIETLQEANAIIEGYHELNLESLI